MMQVRPEDVLKLKSFVIEHIPILIYGRSTAVFKEYVCVGYVLPFVIILPNRPGFVLLLAEEAYI
jgi:hypothetical protein